MKPEKVWNALDLYDRELAERGHPVRQFTDEQYGAKPEATELGPLPHPLTPVQMLSHCRWMCRMATGGMRREFEDNLAGLLPKVRTYTPSEMLEQVAEARKPLEKAMRWLGYVQGVCNALGVYSCNDLRDHSRGGEGQFQTAREEHAPKPVTVTHNGTVCTVRLERYAGNNRVAIVLDEAADGSPYAKATVNLPDRSLNDDEVFVKDYAEQAGMLDALEAAGVVKRTDRFVQSGYSVVPVAKLLLPPPSKPDTDAADEDRQQAIRRALNTRDAYRTPQQVVLLRGTVYGCCDRHADNQGCECLSRAEARTHKP